MSDEMIEALGGFVTEVGDVEYVMFETILAVAEEDVNEVHRAFYNETFEPKVTMLEKRLEHSAFDEHRAGLNHLISMLRKLTSQRNNIIHGETFHITRRNEAKVFRVGFTRKNLTPWKDFNFEGNAENHANRTNRPNTWLHRRSRIANDGQAARAYPGSYDGAVCASCIRSGKTSRQPTFQQRLRFYWIAARHSLRETNCDPTFSANSKARKYRLKALNAALDGITGMTAVHICFGYAAIIHVRPEGYSFLPELGDYVLYVPEWCR